MTRGDVSMSRFKLKVGLSRSEDERRVQMVRQQIGANCDLV